MNEDKKLEEAAALDDNALEGVAGGTNQSFYLHNCRSCRHQGTPNCYYHSTSSAVEELGHAGTCPYKEPI